MSHSIFRILEPDRCESVLAAINDFIEAEYTEANIRSRRALVLEYGLEMEAFAFPVHCPGSPESAHLPGFRLDELPDEIAALTRKTVESLSLERGRVLWNVGRYAAHARSLPEHFDGNYSSRPRIPSTDRPCTAASVRVKWRCSRCATSPRVVRRRCTMTRGR